MDNLIYFMKYRVSTYRIQGYVLYTVFILGEHLKMNRDKSKTENIAITLIRFCVPLILSSILQQLYNWVDAFIVGNVAGEKALAAIGSTGTIVDLFLNAITGFTLGLCILFAQKYGAGKKVHITKILSVFSVILGGIFLLISLIGIAGAYPLLRIMNTTPDTIYMAKDYLQIILIGIPFLAVYNVYSSALRGIGNSRAPFVSVLFSSVVNIILDLVFVSVWHWGVVGAAIATVISQAFMTIFIILYSIKKHSCLRFSVKKWALDHSVLKEGLRLGIPPMIQNSITSLGGLILQNFMNGFGTQTVAAITTAYRVDTMVLLPIVNLGSGISTIVAQNYGAGRKKQIPKIVCVGTGMMFCISLLLTWLIVETGGYLIAMFGVSPEVTEIGKNYFQTIAVFYAVFGIAASVRGYIEGIGDILFSSFAGIISLISRIIFSYAFVGICGNMIIAYAEAGSWGVLLVLYTIHILRKKFISKNMDQMV